MDENENTTEPQSMRIARAYGYTLGALTCIEITAKYSAEYTSVDLLQAALREIQQMAAERYTKAEKVANIGWDKIN